MHFIIKATSTSRRPSILSSIRNKKSTRFNVSNIPKNVVSTQDAVFGMERSSRPSLFNTDINSMNICDESVILKPLETKSAGRRRSTSLNAPVIINTFKKLISMDKTVQPVIESNETSSYDLQLFSAPVLTSQTSMTLLQDAADQEARNSRSGRLINYYIAN